MRTSENSVKAKFAPLKPHRPTLIGQGRRREDAHTTGYYAPEQRVIPEAFLGVRGGAEGFSKNDPIEKLYAVGIYPDEGAQNPLTVQLHQRVGKVKGLSPVAWELRP